mmetsp:Transcript_142402/g.248333  ORF Transcript_142402/g.248333 Transcript_142402/m.248333 type:complete len:214 (-) Transcript_142402:134-775(-)
MRLSQAVQGRSSIQFSVQRLRSQDSEHEPVLSPIVSHRGSLKDGEASVELNTATHADAQEEANTETHVSEAEWFDESRFSQQKSTEAQCLASFNVPPALELHDAGNHVQFHGPVGRRQSESERLRRPTWLRRRRSTEWSNVVQDCMANALNGGRSSEVQQELAVRDLGNQLGKRMQIMLELAGDSLQRELDALNTRIDSLLNAHDEGWNRQSS